MYYLYEILENGEVRTGYGLGVEKLSGRWYKNINVADGQKYKVFKGLKNPKYHGVYKFDKARLRLVKSSDFITEINQMFFSNF